MDPTMTSRVVRTTLIVLLLTGLALLMTQMVAVWLLIFAAILIAVLIRAVADPIHRSGVPETPAVLIAVAGILALLGLVGWMFGSVLGEQFGQLAQRLPGAATDVRDWLARQPFGSGIASTTPDLQTVAGRALTFAFGAVGAITNLVLVLIGAIYLALDPSLYVRGVELLFPRANGPRVVAALNASGNALRKYLLGQLFTMVFVGTLVGIGVAIVGVPSAAALGVIVGLANFVPLIGPFIGAVPGILLAFSVSPETALWAAVVYFIAQQVEGNVLTPIVQRYAVSIPPAVLIFALAGLGGLFGVIGVLVAAPLAVVLYTLVAMLWSRDTLGHDIGVPGQDRRAGDD
ncbi:AI-2E family transporter [Sphingomonas sp. CCH13-B11]|jgi:predicted PurR-regulated permease PerM|uniref:AI-2E family transporter n=2 Tax=Sphingomonas TaxID=13687 RepID=UPI00082B0115|nr:AI-2E family transporter [Sphingomonas sp. CCH13-B11]